MQTSLVQVGMKVRKSISDGYKLPQPERPLVKLQMEHDIARRAQSDSALLVNPYVRPPIKKRARDIKDIDDAELTDDDERPNGEAVDDSLLDHDHRDFADAPFLIPKEFLMMDIDAPNE